MNNLLARRPRRLIGLAAALAVAAGVTVPMLFAGGASAVSFTSVKLTDPIPVQSVTTKGEVFAAGQVHLVLPTNAVITGALVSASPDGAQNAFVDDGLSLVVNGGAPQTTEFHNPACNTQFSGKPPVSGLVPGDNVINWNVHDTCGGASWSTALYIVVSYNLRQPTALRAYAELADVAAPAPGAPLNIANLAGVHLFNLYARLTSNGFPVVNRTVVFHAGSSYVCSAPTDTTGLAHCGGTLRVLAEIPSFRADFLGDTSFLPSTATAGLVTLGGAPVI